MPSDEGSEVEVARLIGELGAYRAMLFKAIRVIRACASEYGTIPEGQLLTLLQSHLALQKARLANSSACPAETAEGKAEFEAGLATGFDEIASIVEKTWEAPLGGESEEQ